MPELLLLCSRAICLREAIGANAREPARRGRGRRYSDCLCRGCQAVPRCGCQRAGSRLAGPPCCGRSRANKPTMVLPTGVTAAAAGALLLLCVGAARAYRRRAARAVGGEMRVLFFSTPELVADAPTPDAAVVIDVLRATTTITCALRCGAEAVQVFAELDALEAAAAAWPADRRVRAGERGGRIVQGFELDNSPAALSPARVEGRRVFLSTTNGTRALQRVRGVPLLLAACLPNRSAVASLLLERGAREVWIVGSGWEGAFSLEDSFCAGAVAAALIGQAAPGRVRCGNDQVGASGWVVLVPLWNCSSRRTYHLTCLLLCVSSHALLLAISFLPTPQMLAALALWTQECHDPEACLRAASHGQRLMRMGNYDADFACCAAVDSTSLVPRQVEPGVLRAR
jgi:2-phosphosulfolactate phosphatase